MKYNSPGMSSMFAETELIFKNGITLFARAERVQNDELLERGEIVTSCCTQQPVNTVGKVTAGAHVDFVRSQNMKFGLGALIVSRYAIPDALKSDMAIQKRAT